MLKPSERIYEIEREIHKRNPFMEELEIELKAIRIYLDEQHEHHNGGER